MDNCRQFIVDVLKLKGPLEAHILMKTCTTSTPNCPKILKTSSFDEFLDFLKNETNHFLTKDKVYLMQDEAKFKKQLLFALENDEKDSLSSEKVEQILSTCGQGTVRYIQAQGQKGIEDFLMRNSDTFVYRNAEVFLASHCKNSDDDKAVKYFLNILSLKGSLNVSQLAGHWNQAPDEVKQILKSTQPAVFKDFLLRNSFYFKVSGETIAERTFDCDITSLGIEGDELEQKAASFFIKKLKKSSQTLQQLVSLLNRCDDPEIVGTVGSKKPLDIHIFLKKFPKIFCVDSNDKVTLLDPETSRQTSCPGENKLEVDAINSMSSHAACVNEIDGSLEDVEDYACKENNENSRTFFSSMFGDGFLTNVNELLIALNIKDVSNVEILWFDLGRHPMIKIRTDNSKTAYIVHELKSQRKVSAEDLQLLLDHNGVVSVSASSRGILGYLHTLRINWLGETPIGVTLFHQTHWLKTDRTFEETQLDNLRVIVYDRKTVSCNAYCSFLRNISRDLAEHRHVIIVDINGKITGYDSTIPKVVGKARRISCTSLDRRSEVLMEAFSHSPDYIVTNCLDVVDTDVVSTLKGICAQGVQVIVAVHQDCRQLLEVHFLPN